MTERRKRCIEIARIRARKARQNGACDLLVALAFIKAFLPVGRLSPFAMSSPPHGSGLKDKRTIDDKQSYSSSLGRFQNRYSAPPSIRRLMRDLRRPAARLDAENTLLSTLTDIDLRHWVGERIHNDEISRLSVFVRPGISDDSVIAAWRSELIADATDRNSSRDDDLMQRYLASALAIAVKETSESEIRAPSSATD